MKKINLHQVSIFSLMALVVIGCSKPEVAVVKPATVQKPTAMVQNSIATIDDIKRAGVNTIKLKGKSKYSQNQSIQFAVDTKGKTGYLYIVYVDNKGETVLLYPNSNSPLTELNGKYLFPKDFGGMDIRATKDCKGCKQEKTTVYAILSKKRISDIDSITAKHLPSSSKGLSMNISKRNAKNANINIGKINFFVK